MTIQEYFGDWSNIVDLGEADRLMKKLSVSRALICPQLKDVFKAFKFCPFHNLRTVVIGMDPYNNLRDDKPVATGIAFANSSDTPEESYSPSLAILKESVIDFTIPHGTVNFDPSLEKWEEQGVLLLNSALSCVIGRPGSHSLMWRPFMKSLLISLSRNASGIVYVLMGSDAQSFEPYINKVNNHIIKAKHPAWYARQKIRMPSDIWREINAILIGQNGYGIEWFKEYKLLNNREDEEVLHE